jgi:acetolactate decarboxylase
MKKLLALVITLLSVQAVYSQVKYEGAMSEMGKTGFASSISLDSLKSFRHLIALGPLGKMEGEITVVDGKMYGGKSLISGESLVVNLWEIQAPFLVYADVPKWKKMKLRGKAESLTELEAKIKEAAILSGINLEEPFFFRIKGNFDQMVTHIVTPRSPEIEGYVAGQNQKNYDHQSESGELIGVYSKTGQRIYTHHDSFMHVHYLNNKKNFTGHLDKFQSQLDQLVIYFPKDRVVRK